MALAEAEGNVKRQPVNFRYDSLNWEFLKLLAEIGHYASEKYGSPEQYTNGRLEGEKSPINHIPEHLRSYIAREPHDHFGDIKYHLAAIAYNCMIEYFYLTHGGPTVTSAFVGGSALDIPDEVVEELSRPDALTRLSGVYEKEEASVQPSTEPAEETPKSILSRLFSKTEKAA